MTTVTFSDLRAHLAEYIDMVETGETVTITRNGKPVAQLNASPERPNPRTAELYAWLAEDERRSEELRKQPLVMRPGFTMEQAEARVAELRAERDSW
jgi:antitoxin (DNA-binding transcriptional repressor) of toxin-antitoxin stability system